MNTVVISSQKELAEWRNRIESAWQKSVQSVIEVGNLVKQAKEHKSIEKKYRKNRIYKKLKNLRSQV